MRFRRHRLGPSTTALAAVVLAVALVSASCSSGDDAGSSGSSTTAPGASGAFSFTDDVDTTVELREPPMRIVASPAAAGALHEYGIDVVGVLGSTERMDGTTNPALGLLDADGLVSLGDTAGELSMEQLAALDPDLVIAESWGEDDSFGMEPDQREQVASQIAPVVRLRVDGEEIPAVLDRFGELAEAIGTARGTGDAVASARAEGKAELDAAHGRLADAAAKQDLKVLAASGSPEQLYVARPAGYADLTYFRDAGVDVVEPTSPVGSEPSGEFWETLSWEEVDRYHADVILADARWGNTDWVTTMIPASASQSPAFAAGQVHPWELTYAFGYRNFAQIVDRLAGALAGSRALPPAS